MIPIKKVARIAAVTALFVSTPLLANESYICKQGDQERKIEIVYANAGSTVPCEVAYIKEDGSRQNLWQAQSKEGYCEEKTAAFIEKQRGWGWDCSKQ